MTRRALWLSGVALLVVLIAITVVVLWRRGRVDPLPPPVRTAVANEKTDRARVDSQLVAASVEAEAAQRRQELATQRANALERTAKAASDRADSLAREAERSATARDSAIYWHLAYATRTAERDTLLTVIAEQDTALLASHDRASAFQHAAYVANTARLRADSVLDAVVAAANVCTVPGTFGRVKCPSRKTALAVGLLGGLATEEVARALKDGRIRISLPFRR